MDLKLGNHLWAHTFFTRSWKSFKNTSKVASCGRFDLKFGILVKFCPEIIRNYFCSSHGDPFRDQKRFREHLFQKRYSSGRCPIRRWTCPENVHAYMRILSPLPKAVWLRSFVLFFVCWISHGSLSFVTSPQEKTQHYWHGSFSFVTSPQEKTNKFDQNFDPKKSKNNTK